jgi:hypothetical protein
MLVAWSYCEGHQIIWNGRTAPFNVSVTAFLFVSVWLTKSAANEMITYALRLVFFVSLLAPALATGAPLQTQGKDEDHISYLDNGFIRLGVNLDLGGAITYI